MDGIHDLGGKHGYGKVEVEEDEPAIHARWEARVFAILMAGLKAGAWNNTDRFRHAIERINPAAYLTHTYYGRWLGGIENMLIEAGILSTGEIAEKIEEMGAGTQQLIAARPDSTPDSLAEVENLETASRPLDRAPGFKVGDKVVTSIEISEGHTRLPAYARGKTGIIAKWHKAWVYPDTNAHGKGENPQHLYSVEFEGEELWGAAAEKNTKVALDLFEPYLKAVKEGVND